MISLKWRLSALYQRDAGNIQLVKALLKDIREGRLVQGGKTLERRLLKEGTEPSTAPITPVPVFL